MPEGDLYNKLSHNERDVTIGRGSSGSTESVTIGKEVATGAKWSVAIGREVQTEGDDDGGEYVVLGSTAKAIKGDDTNFSTFGSVVIGSQASAEMTGGDFGGVVVGYGGSATGDRGVAIGWESEANEARTVSVGDQVVTSNSGEGAIGVDQLRFGAVSDTIPDAALNNSQITFEIDEGAGEIVMKVKESDGTVQAVSQAYDA